MIAGRLRWREPGQKPGMGPKMLLASFEFAHGTLFFTEASSKKRASMQLVRGEAALARARPRRHRAARRDARAVSRRADAREPHAQARAHRSAPLQRHRQRLLGRDPPRGAPVAAQAHAVAVRRGVPAALRGDARDARAVDRSAAAGRRGRLSRKGHRVPRRDGGARPLQAAVSGLRRRRCSGSSTPRTSATTARDARPAAGCSPTARCRGC